MPEKVVANSGFLSWIVQSWHWLLGAFATLVGYIHVAQGRRIGRIKRDLDGSVKKLEEGLSEKSSRESCKEHRDWIVGYMKELKQDIQTDIGRVETAVGGINTRLDKLFEKKGGLS